jgi:hypothetical protein
MTPPTVPEDRAANAALIVEAVNAYRIEWPNPEACCIRNAYEDAAHSRTCENYRTSPSSPRPGRSTVSETNPAAGEPTNAAGGPLLEPHDNGCRCWPHVSQSDAFKAVEHAALMEYRSGRAASPAGPEAVPQSEREGLRRALQRLVETASVINGGGNGENWTAFRCAISEGRAALAPPAHPDEEPR